MAHTRAGGTVPCEGRVFPELKLLAREVQIVRLGVLFYFTLSVPADVVPSLLNVADNFIDGDDWFAVVIERDQEASTEEYEQVVMASLYAIWEELIARGLVHGGALPSITMGDPRDMIPKPEPAS